VNAWVNAGFGADKLVSPADSQWVFRNRDSGQMAAAASLGLVCAWDETRLDALDKYLNAEEEPVRAGASECRSGGSSSRRGSAAAANAGCSEGAAASAACVRHCAPWRGIVRCYPTAEGRACTTPLAAMP
jgi:26S proteasome regulatory subunit N1